MSGATLPTSPNAGRRASSSPSTDHHGRRDDVARQDTAIATATDDAAAAAAAANDFGVRSLDSSLASVGFAQSVWTVPSSSVDASSSPFSSVDPRTVVHGGGGQRADTDTDADAVAVADPDNADAGGDSLRSSASLPLSRSRSASSDGSQASCRRSDVATPKVERSFEFRPEGGQEGEGEDGDAGRDIGTSDDVVAFTHPTELAVQNAEAVPPSDHAPVAVHDVGDHGDPGLSPPHSPLSSSSLPLAPSEADDPLSRSIDLSDFASGNGSSRAESLTGVEEIETPDWGSDAGDDAKSPESADESTSEGKAKVHANADDDNAPADLIMPSLELPSSHLVDSAPTSLPLPSSSNDPRHVSSSSSSSSSSAPCSGSAGNDNSGLSALHPQHKADFRPSGAFASSFRHGRPSSSSSSSLAFAHAHDTSDRLSGHVGLAHVHAAGLHTWARGQFVSSGETAGGPRRLGLASAPSFLIEKGRGSSRASSPPSSIASSGYAPDMLAESHDALYPFTDPSTNTPPPMLPTPLLGPTFAVHGFSRPSTSSLSASSSSSFAMPGTGAARPGEIQIGSYASASLAVDPLYLPALAQLGLALVPAILARRVWSKGRDETMVETDEGGGKEERLGGEKEEEVGSPASSSTRLQHLHDVLATLSAPFASLPLPRLGKSDAVDRGGKAPTDPTAGGNPMSAPPVPASAAQDSCSSLEKSAERPKAESTSASAPKLRSSSRADRRYRSPTTLRWVQVGLACAAFFLVGVAVGSGGGGGGGALGGFGAGVAVGAGVGLGVGAGVGFAFASGS